MQIQGNTITLSLASDTDTAAAAAAATADDDDDEYETLKDEALLRTVVVRDVSDDMEDVVCGYLENPRKNGGPIESSSYDEDTGQLTICFLSQHGMD